MKKQNTFIVVAAVTAAVIAATWLLLAAPGLTGNQINMTRGVTSQSMINYNLHMTLLWICIVIGVIVFSAMFVSIVLHRKSRDHEAAQFTHSTKAEVVWTIIPVLILVVVAVPATSALVNMEVAPETEMTVKITGFQWRWKYEYVEDDINFISSLDPESNAARQLASGETHRISSSYPNAEIHKFQWQFCGYLVDGHKHPQCFDPQACSPSLKTCGNQRLNVCCGQSCTTFPKLCQSLPQ